MRTYFLTSLLFASASVPLLALAQTDFGSLGTLINAFTTNVVKALGVLAMALAVVAFFFGLVQFIWASREGEQNAMSKGKNFMVWGLIALFVMFSVWGIIKFAQGALGIPGSDIVIPSINIGGSGSNNNNNGSGGCTSDANCPSGQVCEFTSRTCKPDPGGI